MIKRFFTAIACVFLFAAALAGSALASSSQRSIAVGGTYLTGGAGSTAYARINEHGYVVTGGEYINENNYDVSWDGSTLTLKNATIDGSIKQASGISFLNGSFTIELIGDNKVIGVSGTAGGSSPGIGVWNGGLTITGEGSLDVTGGGIEGTYTVNRSHGIYARDNIDINSGTITATGGAVAQGSDFSYPISYGICSWNGSVNISGGHVTANGGTSEDHSYGIFADEDVIVTRGTVTANGGKSNSDSHGIRADSVSVIGGTVNANGGVTTGSSCGIYAGSVDVSDGFVNANINNSIATSGNSYGIYATGTVSASGGTIFADGATVTGEGSDSCGIYASGISITKGDITANGGSADGDSYGISTSGGVTISEYGNVTASGGLAGDISCGIYSGGDVEIDASYGKVTATGVSRGIEAEGSVMITDGEVTATATDGTSYTDRYGIYSGNGGVIIRDGNVKATGGAVTGDNGSSYGIYANSGDISIIGGTVVATGGTVTGENGSSYGLAVGDGSIVSLAGGKTTASGNTAAIGGDYSVGKDAEGTAGDSADEAIDITNGANLKDSKYIKIQLETAETPQELNIHVGRVGLYGASGAPAYATTNADGEVTPLETAPGDGNWQIMWDGTTLTLRNATIKAEEVTNNNTHGISREHGNLKIELVGTNTINMTAGRVNTQDVSYGISVSAGDLEIGGTGSLNINGAETSGDSYGIYAQYGVTIENGMITANGGNIDDDIGNYSSYGIYTQFGGVKVTGGSVTASGGEITGDYSSYGIYAQHGGVEVTGGSTVTANGGNVTGYGDSCGIYTQYGGVSVTDGEVKATGGNTNIYSSYGIYTTNGDVSVTGGTVTATGGNTGLYSSYGIYTANGGVSVAGGEVNAAGGSAASNNGATSAGIYATVNFTVDNGTVTAKGGTTAAANSGYTPGSSYGIFAGVTTAINGGTVNAAGGQADGGCAYGIYSDTVNISGGAVNALGQGRGRRQLRPGHFGQKHHHLRRGHRCGGAYGRHPLRLPDRAAAGGPRDQHQGARHG